METWQRFDYDGEPRKDYKDIKNIIAKANGEPEPDLRVYKEEE